MLLICCLAGSRLGEGPTTLPHRDTAPDFQSPPDPVIRLVADSSSLPSSLVLTTSRSLHRSKDCEVFHLFRTFSSREAMSLTVVQRLRKTDDPSNKHRRSLSPPPSPAPNHAPPPPGGLPPTALSIALRSSQRNILTRDEQTTCRGGRELHVRALHARVGEAQQGGKV